MDRGQAGGAAVSFCIVDTNIFCNLIPVPGRDQDVDGVCERMEALIGEGTTLVLPIAAILETGNLIAQCADGNVRHRTACKFVGIVRQAILGQIPYILTPQFSFDARTLPGWLDDFPRFALDEKGMGDLAIVKEFEHLRRRFPHHRVFIWSTDRHLSGYDHPAGGN